MYKPFVFSRELRAKPDIEVLAQVRAPGGRQDTVLTVHDISRSGALIELSDLRPAWLARGREVEFTVIGEGESDGAEFRGPITRIVDCGARRVFAVRLDGPSRRSRRYLQRMISRGRPVRSTALGVPA